MVETEDWVTNGYTYKVVDGELIFSFSEEVHGSDEATCKEISNDTINSVGYDFFHEFSDSDVEALECFLKMRVGDFLGTSDEGLLVGNW